MDDIHKLLNFAKTNKQGFTVFINDNKIHPVSGSSKQRYSVADKTAIVYSPKEKNIQIYSPIKNNSYVGGWFDKSTGKYLIENINLYSNRKQALTIARKRKQKAIFDLIKMNEIKLHYKQREHITGMRTKTNSLRSIPRKKKQHEHIRGMRIKTVSKKKMGDYVAVHGKLPKNELPKRLRKTPKKDVLIRAGLTKKRRKAILRHERIELGLMKNGMKYKPAHRKTEKIMRKHRADVVIKKKGKYLNTITNKYVSKNTAIRLNRFFKKNPTATMYEAYGRPIYDKNKPWIEQSDRLHNLLKKKRTQVIKTRNKKGKIVYFNPLLGKQINKTKIKKAMQYDYQDGQFFVQLYRMTATKDRVYHIITTNLNRTFEEHEDIDRLFNRLEKTWMKDAIKITVGIHHKYPIAKHEIMYVSFDHDILLTNYGQKDNGAINIMKNRTPDMRNMSDFPNELNKARLQYHALLNTYRLITVKKVRIFIYSFATEQNRALSELRLGVYNRNGN